jgi:hypothetical protein
MRKLAWGVLLALLLMAGLGCGGEGNSSRPASESAARGTSSATTATSTPTPGTTPRRKKRSTTKSKATKVATAPSPPPAANPAVFVACDPNIRVKAATTTCPFAQNVFYEYFRDTAGYVSATTVRAWSPAARRFFSVACAGRKPITCTAGDGAEVRFSAEAMEAYDDSQAVRYASTHDTGDPTPTGSAPEDSGSDGSNDFDTGSEAASDFCSTHDCIPNYDEGTGSTVQCSDGTWSHSGGRPGACSWHGGVG